MRLSVRTRILGTYVVLVGLFLVVLFTGFHRLERIGLRLNVIREGYLPIIKMVNTFFNFYHIDETFDVQKLVANRQNRLFLEAVSVHNPRLLENGLRRGLEDARKAFVTYPIGDEQRWFGRIATLIDEVVDQHTHYTEMVRGIIGQVESNDIEAALAQNEALVRQKRLLRARIDFLSRRLDERIQSGIEATVQEERRAAVLTLIFSSVILACTLLIGLVAILAFRPLRLLKTAAREIAAGDLGQRVHIQTNDEVGDLAHEFNRMADAIQQRDETLRKQQEQLIQSEKMAVIGRMASKISHEVRNPLNALGLNVEMLEDRVTEPDAKARLHAMASEIDRLNRVAESYLTLVRKPERSVQPVDPKAFLEHLETLVRPECAKRGIRMSLDVSDALPRVRMDGNRLQQALLNLVRNAMEAVGDKGEFGIRAQTENGHLLIQVWDKGPGIPAHQLSRIFEPFYTTKDKGTGLGLSISNEIVHEQGGSMECKSEPGQGALFTIRLPISTRDV
ncbi:MAG TPA: HAMP domain-containing sensor histidine kinase [Bdellovibrionota bacterium]|nr:HAMP domain-containing sensor histidine kinase [Bdellovibrionota bacterium]